MWTTLRSPVQLAPPLTWRALFCRFVGVFCLRFHREHLVGRRLGALERNSKVNDWHDCGALWVPPLKPTPLLYCTVLISSGPFCPSPQVFLMSLSVFRWLSSSICSSLPSILLISLVLDGERFCHTESAQRSYKCPIALIKKVQDESSSFHTCTAAGGDFLFGWSPWPSSHLGAVQFIWCHVNTCSV